MSDENAQKASEKKPESKTIDAEALEKFRASFTDKRHEERIFRREMGEPEFFRYKKDLAPIRPVFTDEEKEEMSLNVENPEDQTPQYKPEHILSPEYRGESNYERGIEELIEETRQRLENLKNDPNTLQSEIIKTEEDLKSLEYLYQNYHLGMNVFRTAKGGRDKLRE